MKRLRILIFSARTNAFLLGRNGEEASDLIASFRKNGWLPVDQIQVKEIGKSRFVVVEGNRRIAALKHLQRRYQDNAIDLGNLPRDIFDAVPVVRYESSDATHDKVIMGLAHIAGKKRWPPINQARLLRSLMADHGMSEQDVCDALGQSKRELRSTMRTLVMCDLYRESDFGDQFTSEKYNLFREVIRSRAMANWIGWNASEDRPEHSSNVERLFSWISKDEVQHDEEDDIETVDAAINTGSDIRELAKIIDDTAALRTLDETRRLSEATFSSDVLVSDKLDEASRRMNKSVLVFFDYADRLTDEQLSLALEAHRKLNAVLSMRDRQPDLLGKRIERRPINANRQSHFSELHVESHKRLQNITVQHFKRVNLFVGPNNVGKTTLLESIYLLVEQNNVEELLRLICHRGKVANAPPSLWIRDQLRSTIKLSANFDSTVENLATLSIQTNDSGDDVSDKTFYVTSIEVESSYGSLRQSAVTHLFQKRPRITNTDSVAVLCPVVYSSPFVNHDTEYLVDLFNRSVHEGIKDQVVQFIRETLDESFLDVDEVANFDSREFTRFLVKHKDFDPAVDLTQFGEGVQRVFQICLMFASAKNGVVLIDEFENAIHYSLLKPFSRLVQELAVKFNVQVFLTSHSKECVDAFIENDFALDDVSAYAMRNNGRDITVHHYDGPRLERLLDVADIDLRGTDRIVRVGGSTQ